MNIFLFVSKYITSMQAWSCGHGHVTSRRVAKSWNRRRLCVRTGMGRVVSPVEAVVVVVVVRVRVRVRVRVW
jgi:hypothetical protein